MRYVSPHFVAMTDGTELCEKFDQVDTGCTGQKEE
jgi:hypothetical protein